MLKGDAVSITRVIWKPARFKSWLYSSAVRFTRRRCDQHL